MLASSLDAQVPALDSAAGDVHLRIETDRPTYPIGDSIRVRLTLRNVSAHPVPFHYGSHTVMARLRVYDAAGHEAEPTVSAMGGRNSGPQRSLPAGAEMTLLHWRAPPYQQWLNLRDWGYELRAPDRYTIVGVPLIGGPTLSADHKEVLSNEATLTIEP